MNNNNLNNNVNLTPEGTQTPVTIPNPVPQQPVNPTQMPNTGLASPQPTPMNNGVVTPQQPVQPAAMPQQQITPTPMSNPIEQPVMGTSVQAPQPMTDNTPNQNTIPQTPPQPVQQTPQQLNQMELPPAQETPQQPVSPQKQKSNPVLIVLMFVAIIGGAVYFGYNKFYANSSSNIGKQNTGTTVTDNTNEKMQNDEAVKIVKDLFSNTTVQYLTDLPSVTYCKTEEKVYTEEELEIESKWNGYHKCTDYKSYEELSNYFKSFFTEEFYNKDIANKGAVPEKNSEGLYNYYEKDGELYAAITGKAGNLNKSKFLDEKTQYDITNLSSDNISSTINAKWENADGGEYSETIEISLKKINDKWLIDSYTNK